MNADSATNHEEQLSSLLAACDDAFAQGEPSNIVQSKAVPAEIIHRLHHDIAWCQFVRRVLTPPKEPGSTVEMHDGSSPALCVDVPASLGRFTITRELGRGAFGVVFLAHDSKLGREVALKVPLPGVLLTPALRGRFEREAQAAAGLEHPNIVPVYEAGTEGTVCYIASAYVAGRTLAQWLALEQKPIPFRVAARLCAALAAGVAYAHGRGVLHRDLKPSNVLLQTADPGSEAPPQGRPLADGIGPLTGVVKSALSEEQAAVPKITDFGLAKFLDNGSGRTLPEFQTGSGAILGTPQYMAPEQAGSHDHELGPGADIYALGAILYTLITHRPPFQADTPLDTLMLVRTQEPLPPGKLRPGLPRDLETICLHCLQKDPRRRYASAQYLADDLNRYLSNEPIRARPTSRTERFLKWIRRRPAAAALLAVSVSAVLTVLVVILFWSARLEHQRDETEHRRQEAEQQRLLAVSRLRKARTAVDRMLTRVGTERLNHIPQMDLVRGQLFEDALELYRELAREAGSDLDLQHETVQALNRLASSYKWLGQLRKAGECYNEAAAILEKLCDTFPNDPDYARDLALSYGGVSGIYREDHQLQLSAQWLQRAIEIREQLHQRFPDRADYQNDLASSHVAQGMLFQALGSPKEHEQSWRSAIELLEDLVQRFPSKVEYVANLVTSRNNLAVKLMEDHRLPEAEALCLLNLKACEEGLMHQPADPEYLSKLALTCGNYGAVLDDLGRHTEAMAVWNRCVEIRQKVLDDHPDVPWRSFSLGDVLYDMGNSARRHGDPMEASGLLKKAIMHSRNAVELAPNIKEYGAFHHNCCVALAQTLLQLKEHSDAAGRAEEASAFGADVCTRRVSAASILAGCVRLAEQDTRLTPDQRRDASRRYASRAITLLQEAVTRGYHDLAFLQSDITLDPLRNRGDFRQILVDMGTVAKQDH